MKFKRKKKLNDLEQKAEFVRRHNRKVGKSHWAIVPDPKGNMDYFNHLNGSDASPAVSGDASSGDVGGACCESFQRLSTYKYTYSARDVAGFLKEVNPSSCRILYDAILGIYFLDTEGNGIHMDMSREAYKFGMMADIQDFVDYLGDWVNYWDEGLEGVDDYMPDDVNYVLRNVSIDIEMPWLYCMVYISSANNGDFDYLNGADGYDHTYDVYDGYLLTRDFRLDGLYNLYLALDEPKEEIADSLTSDKQRYLYKGPVYYFGKLYADECDEIHTYAKTNREAIRNVCSQLKKLYGFEPNANISIDGGNLILYEFDDTPDTLIPGDDISED